MTDFPTITDRNVQYPNRFSFTDVSSDLSTSVEVTPFDGSAENGTALNSSLFNQIEEYIPAAIASNPHSASDYITHYLTSNTSWGIPNLYMRWYSGKVMRVWSVSVSPTQTDWSSVFSTLGRYGLPSVSPLTSAIRNPPYSWFAYKTSPVSLFSVFSNVLDNSSDSSGGITPVVFSIRSPTSTDPSDAGVVRWATDTRNYTSKPPNPLIMIVLQIGEGVDI